MKHCDLLFFLLLLIASCQQGIDLPNFDEKRFQQDQNGCRGIRNGMKEQLFDITSQLKGLTQTQIQATLGKPDRQALAARNQKYLIYFIQPAAPCQHHNTGQEPLTMYIRFSAINLATEISFKNY